MADSTAPVRTAPRPTALDSRPSADRLAGQRAVIENSNGEFHALVAIDRGWAKRDPKRPTVAVKDCFDVAGLPTRWGSRSVTEHTARDDHHAVASLRSHGWNVMGKAATTEFNVGAEIPCPNPLDPALSAGGSSTGSAVAVATGMADAALGTDTGGSVRWPAAYCGVASLRLTPGGRTDRRALTLSETLDSIGVVAPSVEDLLTLWNGYGLDRVAHPRARATFPRRSGPPTIGVPFGLEEEISDPGVVQVLRHVLSTATERGARLRRVELPGWQCRAQGWDLLLADTARSLGSRFPADVMSPTVRAFVAAGAEVDERRRRAAHIAVLAARATRWPRVDVVVLPVDPHAADPAPDSGRLSTVPAHPGAGFTMPASIAGLPVVTESLIDPTGSPVGIQVTGPAWSEAGTLGHAAWIFGPHPRVHTSTRERHIS